MMDVIPKIGGVKGALRSAWSRLRVLIDSRKPLPTRFWLPRSVHLPILVEYANEGLGNFCYICASDAAAPNLTKGSGWGSLCELSSPFGKKYLSRFGGRGYYMDEVSFQTRFDNTMFIHKSTKRRAQVDPYEAEVVEIIIEFMDDGPNDVPSGNEIDVTQISKSSESSMEGQSHLQGLVSPSCDLEGVGVVICEYNGFFITTTTNNRIMSSPVECEAFATMMRIFLALSLNLPNFIRLP
ncbi:unnamed protein product [Prunus brigantina]